MAGSGGVLLELIKDVTFCAPPVSREKARDMLARMRGAKLLQGYRGSAGLDVEAVVDALVALGRLAVDLEDVIQSVDINPFVALPQGGMALDALIVLQQDAFARTRPDYHEHEGCPQPEQQDKQKEIAFFDGHAAADEYDVFTPDSSARLVDAFVRLTGLPGGARVADLGCGSGVFTDLLVARRLRLRRPRHQPQADRRSAGANIPMVEFIEGDVEHLPFPSGSLDGVLLSGVVHHLPDPSRCAAEVLRVLRPRRALRGLRSQPHEPVHVALPRPLLAVLQLGRRDRERAAGAGARGRGGVRARRASGSRRITSPAWPTVTSRRRGRGCCCRSTISSTPRSSGCASWSRCARSC